MKVIILCEDRHEALTVLHAVEYRAAIEDLDSYLRNKIKHGEQPAAVTTALEETRQTLFDLTEGLPRD